MRTMEIASLTISLFVLAGCHGAPFHRLNPEGDGESISVNELNFKNWRTASTKCVDSLLQSEALKTDDGHKPVIMISAIKNSTTRRVNVNLLTQNI